MRLIPRFAVIPSNGRPCLEDSVRAIEGQVDSVLVILNGDEEFPSWIKDEARVNVYHSSVVGNISIWWNVGLDIADGRVDEYLNPLGQWDIAVINDDVIVPPGWFDRVSGVMRQMQVAAACSGGREPAPRLHVTAGPVDLFTRMQGFAFMLAGEKRLRADETLKWWCGDDDLDWRARQAGGMVMVPGFHVDHLYPNGQMTPELSAQTALDMAAFVDKWGMRPW